MILGGFMLKNINFIVFSIAAIFLLHLYALADSCFNMLELNSEDGTTFFAFSINAKGQVVGERWCASQSRACLWDPVSGMKDIEILCESACNNDPPLAVIGIEN